MGHSTGCFLGRASQDRAARVTAAGLGLPWAPPWAWEETLYFSGSRVRPLPPPPLLWRLHTYCATAWSPGGHGLVGPRVPVAKPPGFAPGPPGPPPQTHPWGHRGPSFDLLFSTSCSSENLCEQPAPPSRRCPGLGWGGPCELVSLEILFRGFLQFHVVAFGEAA